MSELSTQEAIRWLQYARQDLATAEKMVIEGGFVYRHTCFWAQQAAKKALKAIFVYLHKSIIPGGMTWMHCGTCCQMIGL